MKGTEKQVKWASEIKGRIDTALDAMSGTSMQAEFHAFRSWLETKTAAWWIDLWKVTMTERVFLRCAMTEYKKSKEA